MFKLIRYIYQLSNPFRLFLTSLVLLSLRFNASIDYLLIMYVCYYVSKKHITSTFVKISILTSFSLNLLIYKYATPLTLYTNVTFIISTCLTLLIFKYSKLLLFLMSFNIFRYYTLLMNQIDY